MKKERIITESEKIRHSERRKAYNADKTSIQVLKSTHSLLKEYCEENGLVMKDYLNELILGSI